jgi:hypothetical protein
MLPDCDSLSGRRPNRVVAELDLSQYDFIVTRGERERS